MKKCITDVADEMESCEEFDLENNVSDQTNQKPAGTYWSKCLSAFQFNNQSQIAQRRMPYHVYQILMITILVRFRLEFDS